jgi:alkylresorcinol/alkylpyrone synthase
MTHLDPDTACDTHLIASALFGDGAASLVMSTEGPGLFSIGSTCQQIIPNTRRVMAWATGHTSLDMVLDVAVPAIVESQIGPVVQSFLLQAERGLDDFGTIAAHPGSLKVIEAIETALALPKETLGDSRTILEQYGNMSSATVFFIMQNAMRRGASGPFLMSGIGPGMTVALVEGDIANGGGADGHRMTSSARVDSPTASW